MGVGGISRERREGFTGPHGLSGGACILGPDRLPHTVATSLPSHLPHTFCLYSSIAARSGLSFCSSASSRAACEV